MDHLNQKKWNIWIDTGGTFTDCLAYDPQNNLKRIKVLSNGSLRGKILSQAGKSQFKTAVNWSVDKNIFNGYEFKILNHPHKHILVVDYNVDTKVITLSDHPDIKTGYPIDFAITAHEEAPVLACRLSTHTSLKEDLPLIEMRLGSTKGTNALLERKGASVCFLVTRGFADLLKIGTQQRPDLFNLKVDKTNPIYKSVLEVDERLDAQGNVLIELTEEKINGLIKKIRKEKPDSIAICLLHSYKNNSHEVLLKTKLEKEGYLFVSSSSELANAIKVLPRAETCTINAYLDPIINNYLNDIKSKIKKGSLKIMTSAGGLVRASQFHPKDSLLSGPAGGIVGAAKSAALSKVDKIISFDMGGTSTDVARYNKDFDYEYETLIGDARLLSPTLAIETVAAGGGSICYFDGFNLKVGPESAGAYPGPACYGCNGPLTITDVNLLLGRINTSDFNIPLNLKKAEEKLLEIVNAIELSTNKKIEKEEVLLGFLEIANERMAEVIRKISIRKGYDPSDYTLLGFGGAGGQHACDIAELLNIKKIIIPYNAGILSAYGIGNAKTERFAQKEILQPLKEVENKLESIIEQLKTKAFDQLKKEGFTENAIELRHTKLLLRFKGQDTSIELDYSDSLTIEKAFRKKYEALFNHKLNKQIIELESVKCIASSKEELTDPSVNKIVKTHHPSADKKQLSYDDRTWKSIDVFQWENLSAGSRINGNAIITSKNSTVFIKKGWQFYLDEHENGLLEHVQRSASAEKVSTSHTPEAIALELFTNRFRSVADDMGALLQRTAFSVNIKERLDFSCALLDSKGELIVNAPHIPVHLGSLGICVRSIMQTLEMEDGDVIITNHPGFGGSHLPDITLVKPVFYEKQLVGFVANRAHHSEIGGKRPGSMPPDAKNLGEEGVVIPPMHLVKKENADWESIKKLLATSPYPSRAIEENIADLKAGLASLNLGAKNLQNICANFKKEDVQYFMSKIKEQTHKILTSALEKFNNKHFAADESLDDGYTIKVSIKVKDSKACIDFTGTSQTHPANLNATPAITNSAILYVLRLLLKENIPLNEGLLKAITLKLPNCFLNPDFDNEPFYCPAVVGGNTETSQRLVDTLIKALELAACSQGTMNNLLFGNDNFGYYETIGGGVGAINGYDGASGVHQHMTNTRITDPEILEFRYPVRLTQFSIRKNSGGKGKWSGGDGIIREILFLDTLQLTILSQHRKIAPYGLQGGKPGKKGQQTIIRKNGHQELLNGIDGAKMNAGDKILIKTPGGGGHSIR